ncbi:response regulator transcription factor [Paenibacillus beijingensis]|uniref:Transcriptional regulator n=1 Tax=Paenibacillus beijingensis TaxID=1126833 RepID=A0A0D5NF08_9BACL|nr:response regulator transcription factor [Paenibacillus beijingensis]AJY73503.1 transcriptional regulator [Paenibacillus beijingensis]
MNKTILVVDDEDKIRDVVASYLQKDGFRTLEADTGEKALHIVQFKALDLIILDLMLPDMSGEQVCKQIRQFSSLPILMLTAKVSEDNRIHGLSIGADDYLLKPFDPRELVARVRAILRRTDNQHLLADRISFRNDELIIDSVRSEVFVQGEPVNLTQSEYKLLLLLARHPQRQFNREELVAKVLGFDFEGDVRSIDQHVKNLRQKIEPDPKQPRFITTVYGVGYKFIGGAL